ncbi:MAG: flagellar hook-length control protein FliK, partial [Rhodospirillaceae bacterium]|nr:flagellar hook-length control protein FliK [Rhodospirillaceae bacterium]
MEFAAVNSPKSAGKTVAITLTNEEAKNPANAFSALLNLGAGGMKFNAEQSISKAEGQWLRAAQSAQRERDAAQKPKADHDIKPKDKVADAEKPADDEHDDVAAAENTSKKTEKTATKDSKAQAATEAQPTEQVAAVGLDAIQSVAIQFQILVQLPDGKLQDMGTFDLKSLLAAASQDSKLASALEAAFGQAAESLAAGQSLLGDLTQATAADPTAMAALQDLGAGAAVDAGDATNVADLFKQIAAAFRPLAHEAINNAAATQAAKTATNATAAMAEHVAASNDLVTPEVAEQSAALSKLLGDDNKIRIQVAVNGRTVADIPFEYSQFNRYTGYNPEASRTASTANGQAGLGTASNTAAMAEEVAELLTPQTNTSPATPASGTATAAPAPVAAPMAANSGLQTNVGSQQNSNTGTMPREMAAVRAPEAAAPTAANSNTSSQSQPTSFAAALNQTGGNTATTQTAAAERPVPTQPQQVIDQIKVNITRAAKAGMDRVTIQLRPEELGRIEIKLEMTSEGKVTAAVTADKAATLELLQRESRGLERALQDAGLRADANDLQFNL